MKPSAPFESVLITGASAGIGAGLARWYARRGGIRRLGLVARREDKLRALQDELQREGCRVQLFPADVGDTTIMAGVCEEFQRTSDGPQLVIANAGLSRRHMTMAGDAAGVAHLLQTNLIGVSNTLVPFIPAMRARGEGTLVAVSSMAGVAAMPGRVSYGTSKAAVDFFMRGLRRELAGTGVRAITLCPGYVATELTAGMGRTPFLLPADRAVAIMTAAIAAGKARRRFPWQLNMQTRLLSCLPDRRLQRLLTRLDARAADANPEPPK